jgi:phospholipase C
MTLGAREATVDPECWFLALDAAMSARAKVSRSATLVLIVAGGFVAIGAAFQTSVLANARTAVTPLTPIQHVVVIMQENHSFDNVLGKFCVDASRCNGTLTGKLFGGAPIALHQTPDFVPDLSHVTSSQRTAIDSGKMDGFSRVTGCGLKGNYACYSYYDETQIPNLASLAHTYVVADATFSPGYAPSWGGHMAMVTPTNGQAVGWNVPFSFDGFSGDNPSHRAGAPAKGPGWGCDSNLDAPWKASPAATMVYEPSCIPDATGNGPYRPSPVAHVPTIMDSLDTAGLSWNIYGATSPTDSGYIWNICPTFYECASTQTQHLKTRTTFESDAAAGTLPAVSFVVPNWIGSQHGLSSMLAGDNYLASKVSAVMNGPEWSSTAIFISYDDFGGFYDHVSPNTPTTGAGVRVPMVIVSPYAKAGFTDSNWTVGTMGVLAFIEHNWSLPAIGLEGGSYDYESSFDFTQPPFPPIPLRQHSVPATSLAELAQLPSQHNDPT